VQRGFLFQAWHYAHAIEVRLFQRVEWSLLRKAGIPMSDQLRREIWRRPGESEDWINLARFIPPGEAVFLIDVGANVGNFTARAKQEYRDLRAACFEPASANFQKLARRFSNDTSIALYQIAASDENTTATMYTGRSDTLFSLERYDDEANREYGISDASYAVTETVACRRLDNFNLEPGERRVLLKVDVQGHEEKALVGAAGVLPMVDVVIIECSFANEYKNISPSFAGVTQKLATAGLYPVIFQDYGRSASAYAFERDVIFVREHLLKNIWYKNYGI
jgi:FkbM family methyltransferase